MYQAVKKSKIMLVGKLFEVLFFCALVGLCQQLKDLLFELF
jgi:hypothetical protein